MLIIEDGVFVDCNSATVAMLGYDRKEEIVNTPPFKLSPEFQSDGQSSFEKAIKMMQLAGERGNHQFEWEHLRKDGSIFPVEVSLTAIRTNNRSHLHTVWRDITKRKQTEKFLRDSEERFRQVAMTNWVWETDLDGRYTYCSDNVIDTLGYTPEEILGQTPFDFMPEREAVRVNEIFVEIVTDKKQIIDLENWNITKNGDEVCLLTNGVPFFDNAGNLIGYRGGDRDITDRKRAEQELAKYRGQLELLVEDRTLKLKEAQSELIQRERLATLGRLTATVSHEIRNPLGTIQMAIFSIGDSLERNEPHRIDRSLKLAERNIIRCVNIIEELTSYTRVKGLDISRISLDAWLKTVLDEQTIPEEIRCELDLSSGICAPIDQEKLRQVIINLITNAIHALLDENSSGKLLQISTRLLGGEYEICVRDDGVGMSDEIKGNVFEPLYSTKGFGVGLGMVIAKDIVEQHHGEISIESKEGKGTTVGLRFPIRPAEGEMS